MLWRLDVSVRIPESSEFSNLVMLVMRQRIDLVGGYASPAHRPIEEPMGKRHSSEVAEMIRTLVN